MARAGEPRSALNGDGDGRSDMDGSPTTNLIGRENPRAIHTSKQSQRERRRGRWRHRGKNPFRLASALFDNSRRRSPRKLRERSGRGCRRLRALGSLDAPPRYPSGASGCSKPAENRLGYPLSLARSAGLVVNFLREPAACLPLVTSARCFGSPRRLSSRLPRSRSRSPARRGSWAAASSSPSSTRTSTDATTAWSPARSSSCRRLPGTS